MNHSNQTGNPAKRVNVLGAAVAVGAIINGGISYYDPQAGGINEPNQLIEKEDERPYGGISTQPMPNRVVIYDEAPVSDSVDDNMSFNEAFRTARNEVGAGGVFEWRGNLYNTYYREEWAAMSAEEQAQYAQSVPIQSEITQDDQPFIIEHSETTEDIHRVEINDKRIENGRIVHRVGVQETRTIIHEEIMGSADDSDPEDIAAYANYEDSNPTDD